MRGSIDHEEYIKHALQGEILAIYDAANDPRIFYDKEVAEEGVKSMLVIPLIVHGTTIGLMELLMDEYRTFAQDEVDFATALAEEAALSIENVRMYRKIKEN